MPTRRRRQDGREPEWVHRGGPTDTSSRWAVAKGLPRPANMAFLENASLGRPRFSKCHHAIFGAGQNAGIGAGDQSGTSDLPSSGLPVMLPMIGPCAFP